MRLKLTNMKKTIIITLSIILAFGLSGCSLIPSLNLTESEQSIIAEYAAGLLLKYDKNYSGAIRKIEEDDSGVMVYEEEETPIYEESFEEEEYNEFADPEFSEELMAEDQSEQKDESEYSDISISDAIGLDGFTVMYKNYEVHNIYPEEESDELVFSLQAQEGMELLVLDFGITNDGADKKLCDVLNSETSYRIIINDSEVVQANKTILLNDLSAYYEEIEGYGMANAVLVCEVAEGTSQNISKLDLRIKKGDETTTHPLR